ncbi:hypothetical protein D3C84_862210 [compost metagenome]
MSLRFTSVDASPMFTSAFRSWLSGVRSIAPPLRVTRASAWAFSCSRISPTVLYSLPPV